MIRTCPPSIRQANPLPGANSSRRPSALPASCGSGACAGATVAVWIPDGAVWLQLLFGAAQLGVLVVPVSTRLETAEALHVVNTAQARMLVVPTRFLDFDYMEAASAIQHAVRRAGACGQRAGDRRVHVGRLSRARGKPRRGVDPWCTFSTSGTTGCKPKLAVHTQAGIVTHVLNVAAATDMRPGDATLCALPLYGVMGFVLAISSLAAGAACVFLPVFEAQAAAESHGTPCSDPPLRLRRHARHGPRRARPQLPNWRRAASPSSRDWAAASPSEAYRLAGAATADYG